MKHENHLEGTEVMEGQQEHQREFLKRSFVVHQNSLTGRRNGGKEVEIMETKISDQPKEAKRMNTMKREEATTSAIDRLASDQVRWPIKGATSGWSPMANCNQSCRIDDGDVLNKVSSSRNGAKSTQNSINARPKSVLNYYYYHLIRLQKNTSGSQYKNNCKNYSLSHLLYTIILIFSCVILVPLKSSTPSKSTQKESPFTSSLLVSAYQLTNNLIANNLPPKFATSIAGHQVSNSEIVVRVKEGPASIGKLINTLKGEDPDEDPLTFGVLGSMASDLLRIENVPGNQANVYLRKELDRETTESHQVVITLTDGKLGRGNWVSSSKQTTEIIHKSF